ncbi:MAG: zinc-binding dehydrogenase [Caldilineaceae bacterium]|nr:zinc-binding dehydrogenase [Caldilineaceae bacterium]
MRKATITGVRQGGVVEIPAPQAKADWVVVKVHTAPMCTEYKAFLTGAPSQQLGHEAAGEVVEVTQPGRWQVGDRVVVMPQNPCGVCSLCLAGEYIHCQDVADFAAIHGSREGSATMAEYLLKQERQLVPIPDGMSYDHASMACCGLGPTFGALERVGAGVLDTVLITGLGPVGLGGVINATFRGARVIGVESNPWRAQKARKLGAEAVVDPSADDALAQILALTADGRGVEHSLDCSGVSAAHRLCIDAARRKGTVSFVGESGRTPTELFISDDMIRKGLTLRGSWHYNLSLTPKILRVIAANTDKLDRLISHRFALEDVQSAWETQVGGECAKILLKP